MQDERDTIKAPPLDCKACGGTGIKVSFARLSEANPVLSGNRRVGHFRASGALGPLLRLELCDHSELEELTQPQPNNERPT